MVEDFVKPECELVGTDGNIFAIVGRVCRALSDAGMRDRAQEFQTRALKAQSYDEVLQLLMDYVEPY